ncbi:hypothetical protein R7D64_23385 [Vibrio sp. Vb2535]|uniref:hypothetical protein n=1 Tax=Vibrio TaxID=662 RepID=UPI002964B875|nr:hypothetical protein [Vibrio sp. Vb2535]MDW1755878.1 hypothetical protein [Vibrio sp. Vb2535]
MNYFSFFIVMLYIVLLLILIRNDSINKTLLFFFSASLLLILFMFKSYDYGDDFKNYHLWLIRINDIILVDTYSDILLKYFFNVTYLLSDSKSLQDEFFFKFVIYLWFFGVFSIFFIMISNKINSSCLLLFFILLISSRLFHEYSTNTLRSFSSAIILSSLFISERGYFAKALCLILAFLVHFKATLLVLSIFIPSIFIARKVSPKTILMILYFLLIYFSLKLFISSNSILNFEFLREKVFLLGSDYGMKLHSDKISSDFSLSFSLYLQYTILIFIPLLISFKDIKSNDVTLIHASVVSLIPFSFLFPQVFLLERFGQFGLILATYLLAVSLKNHTLNLTKTGFLGLLSIFNVVSLYFLFQLTDLV